jgi:uncharacterized membrane protein (UPF0127 family)
MRRSTALLCTLALTSACAACASAPVAASQKPEVELHGHRIKVEIAADDASRAHGLMDRTSMPAGQGMLFVFPDSQIRTFWMKNTLIPLDMLFFDADRKLVTLHADVPPCGADPCATYPSTAPARYVLELNAGTATKLGVREGDVATFIDVPSTTQ